MNLRLIAMLTAVSLLLTLSACGSGGPGPDPQPTAPRVVSQVITTGAGPNDMVFGNNSLYVANSLDNTVVRYSLSGAELATATFDVGASPSFLRLDGANLWVVCNGDNTTVGLGATDLARLPDGEFDLQASASVFMAPGQPSVIDGEVFVPRSEIASFGPTVYGPGLVSVMDYLLGTQSSPYQTGALNPQFTSSFGGNLFVICTGDIQFDEQFVPSAVTDSYIEQYDASPYTLSGQVNFGKIGAGRMAINATGEFAYLCNSLNGNLYKAGIGPLSVLRGPANPIVLTTEFTFISDADYSPDGSLLFAASFNTDEVFVVDTASDAVGPTGFALPFDLSLDPQLLAGCANVEVVPGAVQGYSYSVYVLLGVANSISRIDIP